MLGKCLAAIAISSAMLLSNGGLPGFFTTAQQSAPLLRTLDEFEVSPITTRKSRNTAGPAGSSSQKASAADVARTQTELRNFKTDWMDTFVPDGAVPLLTSLKHQLRDVVLNVLNTTSQERLSPEMAQTMALSNLSNHGAKIELPDCDAVVQPAGEREYAYGDIYGVTVRQPTSNPDLLVITTTLGVCCGDDTSLYLARRQGQSWAIIMAEEADGYNEVSGAPGYFQYYVSEPDTEGRFFLVTANVTPWCTSNWQELRYQVSSPGTDPYHPTVVQSGRESVFLGDDTAFALSGEPRGFSLRFRGEYSLDSGILIRDHIIRYKVEGNYLTRIHPVAIRAEDFLDEWINMPWRDAVRWSDPTNSSDLGQWHALLHDKKSRSTDGLSFVQPCGSTSPGHLGSDQAEWQIGLDISPEASDGSGSVQSKNADKANTADDSIQSGNAAGAAEQNCLRLPPTLFFTVARSADGFVMKHIASIRPPGCPGEAPPEAYSR
jgi:hypothetical protein